MTEVGRPHIPEDPDVSINLIENGAQITAENATSPSANVIVEFSHGPTDYDPHVVGMLLVNLERFVSKQPQLNELSFREGSNNPGITSKDVTAYMTPLKHQQIKQRSKDNL